MPTELSRLPIERVAFGIRYRPQYRVRDNLGAVVDQILRSQPFGPDTFPQSDFGPTQHTLLNPVNGDHLTISQEDALLEIYLGTDQFSKVQEMGQDFNSIVAEQLKRVCNVSDAFRFGFLIKFEELKTDQYACPVEKYADPFLNGRNSDEAGNSSKAKTLNIQFSYNRATPEGFSKKDVNDYRKITYILNQEETDRFFLAVDYQHYFNPVLAAKEWSRKLYDTFVSEAIAYHQSRVTEWIGSLAREERAAA